MAQDWRIRFIRRGERLFPQPVDKRTGRFLSFRDVVEDIRFIKGQTFDPEGTRFSIPARQEREMTRLKLKNFVSTWEEMFAPPEAKQLKKNQYIIGEYQVIDEKGRRHIVRASGGLGTNYSDTILKDIETGRVFRAGELAGSPMLADMLNRKLKIVSAKYYIRTLAPARLR